MDASLLIGDVGIQYPREVDFRAVQHLGQQDGLLRRTGPRVDIGLAVVRWVWRLL